MATVSLVLTSFITFFIGYFVGKYINKPQIINDWKIVEAEVGNWVDGKTKKPMGHCTFNILYSKKLNEYKLEYSGHKPTNHSLYPHFINKINEYNDKLKPAKEVKNISKHEV